MAATGEPGSGKAKVNRLPSVRSRAMQTNTNHEYPIEGVLIHEVDEGTPCLNCNDCDKGFSLHYWRKVCANCHCAREDHDIRPHEQRQAAVGKLLFHSDAKTMVKDASKSPQRPRASIVAKQDSTDSPSILRKTDNYTWIPRDINIDGARAFFEGLPENKKPIAGTPGDRYWQKQKIRQLPAHDIDLIYCNDLTDDECKQMEVFIKLRREKFLGRGVIKSRQHSDKGSDWVCCSCKIPFKIGEAAVIADKLSTPHMWHPSCFVCTDCHELIVELIYFVYEGKIYCGRHHSEKLKPRCAACDEIIFCLEYTRAEEQNWHVNHFCCRRCDDYLGGQNYIAKEGQPYCLKCYELLFANVCMACGSTIPLDEPVLKHEGKYWHAKPECFNCHMCKKPLVDQAFLPKSDKVFCSKTCFREYRDSRKEQ